MDLEPALMQRLLAVLVLDQRLHVLHPVGLLRGGAAALGGFSLSVVATADLYWRWLMSRFWYIASSTSLRRTRAASGCRLGL